MQHSRKWVKFTTEEESARRYISKYNQSDLRLRYKLWFEQYKEQHVCVICKKYNPMTLEFHHLDRKIKKYSISTMISQCMRLEDIQAELKKCIAVCPSCHADIEKELISYREVLEKAKEKYSEYCRPGENIHVGFTEWMLAPMGFTIVSKYDVDYIKNERVMHNLERDYLEKHPDYVNFCKKRIESKDAEVDMELYRPDVLGEFDRGFTHRDLY